MGAQVDTGAYLRRALAKCFRWRCRVKEVVVWEIGCITVWSYYSGWEFVTHRRHSCTHGRGVCFSQGWDVFSKIVHPLPRSFPWENVPWLPLTVPVNSWPSVNCSKPKVLVPPPHSWIDLAREQPARHITYHPTHHPTPRDLRRLEHHLRETCEPYYAR